MANRLPNYSRIESIDLLRGIVMIIMALDHVRDYFHADAFFFDPTDLEQTHATLFFTRFITHFCAPVFVFLAGTSAFFVGQRKGKTELSKWLIKRGLWLIIAEITIIKLAWMFKLDFSVIVLQVIWVLGAAMIFLSGFIHLPKKLMITVSLLVIFGHNAFDSFQPADSYAGLWTFLHAFNTVQVGSTTLFVGYPLIPWIFVMPLGYYFGLFYRQDFDQNLRIKALRYLGLGMIGLFIIIRAINVYGDPNVWSAQSSATFTLLSFLNLAKYPPSLLYLLITLGPAVLLLSFSENWKGKIHDAIVVIGRVPMFFYIIHIYVIHLLALAAVVATGYSPNVMVIDIWVTMSPDLQGYGFDLWVVYAIWIALTLGLYPICRWYWKYKSNNRDKWWLSYL